MTRAARRNMNYTYIVKCSDGTLYCGWTNDLEKRIAAHNAGTGAKYTKTRRPVELVYHETFETKEEAMSREWHLKQLTRQQKEELIFRERNPAGRARTVGIGRKTSEECGSRAPVSYGMMIRGKKK